MAVSYGTYIITYSCAVVTRWKVSFSVSVMISKYWKILTIVKNQERLVLILCVWSVDFPTRNVRVCSNVMTSLTAISLEVIIGGTYCWDVKVGADLPPCYCFKGQGSLWWLVWVSRGTVCFEFHHCYTKHLELTLSFLNGSDTSYIHQEFWCYLVQ